MKIDKGPMDVFEGIPDDLLMNIAINDRMALNRLCIAVTLDVQLLAEELEYIEKLKNNKKNLVS